MTIRALIVDDEPEIIRTAGEVVRSLEHDYESAADIQTARGHLEEGGFDYLILDMNLPLSPDHVTGRRENGRNFIATVRGMDGLATLPIIVITGHGEDDVDFAVSVMKTGNGAYINYLQKPLDGDKLDTAIQEMLNNRQIDENQTPAPTIPLSPFKTETRQMVIYEDRVTLCDVVVWQDKAQPDVREVLLMLSQKTGASHVRIPGRNASNQIGKPIQGFRDRCTELMETCKHLDCGKFDVIGPTTGGGYHFTEWIEASVDGSEAPSKPVEIPAEPAQTDPLDGFNERQQKILKEIERGSELRQKDVIGMFRRRNASTIKRDIKGLRDAGLIATHRDGYYVRKESAK